VSFLGGLSRAARNSIIIKSPTVLEALAKTKTLFFDKTGTLTLGEPELKKIEVLQSSYTEKEVLELAAALGEGISGIIQGTKYHIGKSAALNQDGGILSELSSEGVLVARFFFDDTIKEDVEKLFEYFRTRDYSIGILTGDKQANAHRLFGRFRIPVYAECSPANKSTLVMRQQRAGHLVGMVGDGMNDAPALALADVGIVFSGTENSASIEAADVAILGRDAWKIRDAVHIGRRSYLVARQSIVIGIGLSFIGMLFAFFGFIPPVYGAVLQEIIDVVVIVNALRSTY
jgi:P-type E1-E2 ATPase